MLSKSIEDYAVNIQTFVEVCLFILKFIFSLIVYKVLGTGNKKEISLTLYNFRICFDFFVFGGTLTVGFQKGIFVLA